MLVSGMVYSDFGLPQRLEVKESACKAGSEDLIPGLGRSPGEGHGTCSSIPAWEIPWTEEPGGPESTVPQSQKRLK